MLKPEAYVTVNRSMEEILANDPSLWVNYIGTSVDDTDDATVPVHHVRRKKKHPAEAEIVELLGLSRARRVPPFLVSFPTMKKGHSSKERRYIPSPSRKNRVHSKGGKGATFKKNELQLNDGVTSFRRTGRYKSQAI